MSNQIQSELEKSIDDCMHSLEENGDVVVATSIRSKVTQPIISSIKNAYEGLYGDGAFTEQELQAICSLINHAIDDEKFFDWEMPTLTGFTKSEFNDLAAKIRGLT